MKGYMVVLCLMAAIVGNSLAADVISGMGTSPLTVGDKVTTEEVLAFGDMVDMIIFLSPGNETVAATLYGVYHSEVPGQAHVWANDCQAKDDAILEAAEAGVSTIMVVDSKGEVIEFIMNLDAGCGCEAMG